MVVLEHDDQVGERRARGSSSGIPRSMPALAVIPAIEIESTYSTSRGPIPLATTGGTAAVTSSRVANGASRVATCSGRGWSRRVAAGDQGQRALGPDDELGEVVAGGGLHELAAGADHLAGAEHRLEAEHVVAGDAVLDRPHAAGVGGHVAAEAGRLLAGEHRVHEAVGRERGVELRPG